MSDLDNILKKMLAEAKEAKKAKSKPKAKTKAAKTGRTKSLTNTPVETPKPITNIWDYEALVVVATTIVCRSCGNESTYWQPYVYIERSTKHKANPVRSLEILRRDNYAPVYGNLPKRIEHRNEESCACPLCFGLADNCRDEFYNGVSHTPQQLQLPFNQGEI